LKTRAFEDLSGFTTRLAQVYRNCPIFGLILGKFFWRMLSQRDM
jgi:hypothetical protein